MELTNPTARALAQPHIVQSICNELPDESLAAAARINRNFFLFATEAKWHNQPPLWALQQRVQPSRRQLYASKVRSFALDEMAMRQYHRTCRRVQFDGVRKMTIKGYKRSYATDDSNVTHGFMHRYLAQQLETLVLADCSPTNSLLRTLESQCHQLRTLRFSMYHARFEFETLATFIAANPLLEELQLEPSFMTVGEAMPPPLLLQCARQRKLRFVKFPSTMIAAAELYRQIEAEVSEPFPSLERICWANVPSIAVPLLGKWSKNLSEIILMIQDTEVPIVQPLAQMTKLQKLRLHIPLDTAMSKSEVMALSSLRGLEQISLTVQSAPELATEFPLTADEFTKWIAHFPALQEFEMELPVTSPRGFERALAALACHCPRMKRLVWPANIDFSELDLETLNAPVFPSLRFLRVQFASTDPCEEKFP